MSGKKNQKLSESKSDKISGLPDCVLRYILSLIPTKDAVATCILSKRWKFLWTSVPNIDFDDALLYTNADFWYPVEVTRFMNFVERVLLLRDSSSIKKFRLSCRVCFSASRVHAWVSAAVMHDIEELDLCFFVEKPFMLPLCVFCSKSLTVLKLQMNCELQLPNCISFPSLKTLELCLFTFVDDESMEKLFSNCPVLEELSILDCEWVNLTNVTICIPTLKSLTIDDLPYYGTFDVNGCRIKIDAENLMHLSYSGYLCNELIPFYVPSLVKAHIHIPNLFEDQKEVVPRTAKLLRGLQHVHILRMSTRTIKVNVHCICMYKFGICSLFFQAHHFIQALNYRVKYYLWSSFFGFQAFGLPINLGCDFYINVGSCRIFIDYRFLMFFVIILSLTSGKFSCPCQVSFLSG